MKERELDEIIQPKWYLVSLNSHKKYYWDLVIILFAIYNAILTPIGISFDYVRELQEETSLGTFDMVVNIFFAIDIFVGFTTTFID